jgi:EpsD family peptidyl-prolyl cis-trans isomerase
MNHFRTMLALTAVLSVALVACGQKKDANPAAVKVNGEPISAAEIEDKLAEFKQMQPNELTKASSELLKVAIDSELMRQAALKDKLDADEKVRAKLNEVNRSILADAYMQKVIIGLAKPGSADIKKYYDEHPELYAKRANFDLQELVVRLEPDNAAKIKDKFGDGKKFEEFVRWLTEKKIPQDSHQRSRTSEQLPPDILRQLNSVQVGEAISLVKNGNFVAVKVNSVQPQPVALAEATTAIEHVLRNKTLADTMQATLKGLRDKAKIEYVPPYSADGMAAPKDD